MRQGEIYLFHFKRAQREATSEPAGRRPVLVVQSDRFNRGGIQTAIVAALTSNVMLAASPGNVRLRKGEANLPRASVVNVTQLRTVDRSALGEHVGTLGPERMRDVLLGLTLVLGTDRVDEDV